MSVPAESMFPAVPRQTQEVGAQITNRGFVRIKTPGQVTAEQDGTAQAGPTENIDYGAVRHGFISGQITRAWSRNKMNRQTIDIRLLACLQARKAMYSPQQITEIQKSGANSLVYLPVSQTKCRALVSWLKEILQSTNDRPCGLEPRHTPDLPPEVDAVVTNKAEQKALAMANSAIQNGGEPVPFEEYRALADELHLTMTEEVKAELRRRAQKAATNMEQAVFGVMDTGGWDAAFSEFIDYFSTYPTAFLKGPYLKRRKTLAWGPNWQPIVKDEAVLTWSALNPFDAYPAPLATSCQDRDFIERMRLSESELYDLIGLEYADDEAIRWVLQNHQVGTLRNWIWTDAERNRLEGDTNYNWFAQDDLIDALNWWGSISGHALEAWGVTGIQDRDRRYEVNAILVGSRVVWLAINDDPLGRRPYRSASYEATPGSIWGQAVPELCASHQAIANAAGRALVNNMGIASGPQVGVNVDRLPAGEDITAIYPWKIWQFTKDDSGGSGLSNKPLEFFQPESRAQELIGIAEKYEDMADNATGIPRYSYGSQDVSGAAGTASGLSMLMGAAAKGIRRAISDIEFRVITETVSDVFTYLMLYSQDRTIKGDCVVVPRGTTALLVKEQLQQGRLTALQIVATNPLAAPLVGKRGFAKLLSEFFKGLNLPDVLPEGAELDQRVTEVEQMEAEAATAPDPKMAIAQMTNDARLQATRETNQSRERIAAANIARDLSSRPEMPNGQTGERAGGSTLAALSQQS